MKLETIKDLAKYKILVYSPNELTNLIQLLSDLGLGDEMSDYTFCNFKMSSTIYMTIVYLKKDVNKLPFKKRPLISFSELSIYYSK